MKRGDFIFTIGYHGGTAIVDGVARKEHGNASAEELMELGLYRAAFCAALFDGKLDTFLPVFTARTSIGVTDVEQLKRVFGVFEVPDSVEKVVVIK